MEQKLCRVIDSSCTSESPLRVHEVMYAGEIKKIEFRYGQDTVIPYHLAVKFVKDGFSVMDHDGSALDQPAFTDDTIKSRIGPDEVVAKLDELEVSALQMRAVILPGGEKFLQGPVQKEELIAFLKAPVALPVEQSAPEPVSSDDLSHIESIEDLEGEEMPSSVDIITANPEDLVGAKAERPDNIKTFDVNGVDEQGEDGA